MGMAAQFCPRVTVAPCLAAVHARSPPLSIVRRFIHLLEQSQHDFWEESEVLRLQEEVVKRIRASRQLESDLDLMDIKIGLLVKNRITLQVGRRRHFSVRAVQAGRADPPLSGIAA